MVMTADFITPPVDDPFVFGQIAAANALSDVFAMGARPVTCLSLVGFPSDKLEPEILHKMVAGALERITAAGAVLGGGEKGVAGLGPAADGGAGAGGGAVGVAMERGVRGAGRPRAVRPAARHTVRVVPTVLCLAQLRGELLHLRLQLIAALFLLAQARASGS